MNIEKLTTEELRTLAGGIMSDLRSSWAFNYLKRMNALEEVLNLLKTRHGVTDSEVETGLLTISQEREASEYGDYDGRAFRDCAELYDYLSDEGMTDRVYKLLERITETGPHFHESDAK